MSISLANTSEVVWPVETLSLINRAKNCCLQAYIGLSTSNINKPVAQLQVANTAYICFRLLNVLSLQII